MKKKSNSIVLKIVEKKPIFCGKMDKLKFYIYTKNYYISVNTLVIVILFSQFIVVKKIYKMVQKITKYLQYFKRNRVFCLKNIENDHFLHRKRDISS